MPRTLVASRAQAEPLYDGLLAWYNLDESGSGDRRDIRDVNANLPILAAVPAIASVAGIINKATKFNGSSTTFLSKTLPAFPIETGDYTISLWVRLDNKVASRAILSKGAGSTTLRAFLLYYDLASDRFKYLVQTGTASATTVTATSLGSPAVDTWYHIVIQHTVATKTFSMQINNGGVDTAVYTGAQAVVTVLTLLLGFRGISTPATSALPGSIETFGIWTRNLTATEITALYGGRTLTRTSIRRGLNDIAAFWPFETTAVTDTTHSASDSNWGNRLTGSGIVVSPGKIGNALDATLGVREVNNVNNESPNLGMGGTSFTVAGWVMITSKAANGVMFTKGTGTTQEYLLYYDFTLDRFVFELRQGATVLASVPANSFGSPALSTWYHVLGQFDVNTLKASIAVDNGVLDTVTSSGDVLDTNGTVRAGSDGTSPLVGMLDALGIWRKLLPTDEKATLYNGGVGREYPFPDPVVSRVLVT